MVTRRQGREWALQMLAQFDLNPPESVNSAISDFWDQQVALESEALAAEVREARVVFTSSNPRDLASLAEVREFTEVRVRGVWADREAIDSELEQYMDKWPFYRLGTIERAVLRLGAWEIRNCTNIPVPILINEAVDLAKWFSESKSGRFVNGVLDRLGKRTRSGAAEGACSQD